jgi:hypothetical protein
MKPYSEKTYSKKIVNSVRFWIRHQRPGSKAKSLGMTKTEYSKEYVMLIKMKIAGLKDEIMLFSLPSYSDALQHCIEILNVELKKYGNKR